MATEGHTAVKWEDLTWALTPRSTCFTLKSVILAGLHPVLEPVGCCPLHTVAVWGLFVLERPLGVLEETRLPALHLRQTALLSLNLVLL